MRNAVIENGVVTNIIEGTVPDLMLVPDDGTAQIGSRWDSSQFLASSFTVPQIISPRQIRQALTKFGYRAGVEDAIESSNDQDLKDWWHYSTEFDRQHPKVMLVAAMRGYTSAQVDQVWAYGASI